MAVNQIPEVAANNAQADAVRDETNQMITNQSAQNQNDTEKLFFVNLSFRESANQGQAFFDSYVSFVETISHKHLNELAAHNQLDIPHPDAVSDWVSTGRRAASEADRWDDRMDRIGDVISGELPQEAQSAQDRMAEARGEADARRPEGAAPAPVAGDAELAAEEQRLREEDEALSGEDEALSGA